jgi:uncharacterized membrane protein YfcA
VIELPDSATFAALLSEPRFWAAAGIAVIGGAVRGFSGFGSALIYVPLIAAVFSPRVATCSFVLLDFVCVVPFAARALPHVHWREVLPAYIAAALTVPLGTLTQQAVDPIVLRWGMALLVLGFVAALASGWRYPFKPSAPAAIGAGALSGFTGGAAQLGGPPIILYWLGGASAASVVRTNLLVYLAMLALTLMANYAWHGLMTAQPIALAVSLWPVYIVALVAGTRWFRGASETGYRRIAYVIVALAAFASMPVFDSVLH